MNQGFRRKPFREEQILLITDEAEVKNIARAALDRSARPITRQSKAKTPAERKQRQKAKEAALGMARFEMRLTRGERERIRAGAERNGFKNQTEYLISLVLIDTDPRPKRDGSRNGDN